MTVITTTKKAVKLEKNGVKFWVQKRWHREDGTLTPAGEKAYEIAVKKQESSNSWFRISDYQEHETAKAIMIKVAVDYFDIERDGTEKIWFPKSCVKNGCVQGWLLKKKVAEIQQYNQLRGGCMIVSKFDRVN